MTAPPIVRVTERVDALEGREVTYRKATVDAVNPAARTIDVMVENAGKLEGLSIPEGSFFPKVGDVGELRLQGSRTTWVANRLAPGSVGEEELGEPVKEQIAVAIASANGKNTNTYSLEPPPALDDGTGRTVNDPWWQLDSDGVMQGSWRWNGSIWEPHVFGDAMFDSIDAGKIVTGILGVGVKITVGDPTIVHTLVDGSRGLVIQGPDGFGGFRELNRYGRELTVIDPLSGEFLASVDDTGFGSFSGLATQRLSVGGRDLATVIEDGPRGEVAHFKGVPGFDLAPIFNPVGVAEVGFPVYRGRSYLVKWSMYVFVNAGVQAQTNFRWTQGAEGDVISQAPPPLTTSPSFGEWRFMPGGDNKPQIISGETLFVPSFTSRVRMGITAQVGPDGAVGFIGVKNTLVEINVTDVGIHKGNIGVFSNMGGSLNGQVSPPPPVNSAQQYFADLAPVGRASWRGDGTRMTWVGGDVYQGYEATNGNTRGQFWFDLPNITGNVDRVDLWVYFRHWYFNSGGTMRLGITDQRNTFTDHTFRGIYETGGWPKPGGKEIPIPADWYALFKGTNNNSLNGRGTCLNLGPGVGTNQLYYGVATDARLRIYYTQ